MEAPVSFYDLLVGTGALLIQDSDEKYSATFTAVPMSEISFNEGAGNNVDEIFRRHKMLPEVIEKTWRGVKIDRTRLDDVNKKIEIMESCIKNENGKYDYKVFNMKNREVLYHDVFRTNPWVIFRWSKVSGEVYGRGPLMSALPDIKTLNKTVELILKNAAIAISGIYTAADDGVLNPNLVEIAPGVIIPVAYNGGVNGRSLDVLPRSGDFSVGELVLNDLRRSVKEKLFDTASSALDDAVRSAEEVRWRQKEEIKLLGPVFTRLVVEFVEAIITRLSDLWSSKGRLPEIEVDGKVIKLEHRSPIALSQDQEDVNKVLEAKEEIEMLKPGLSALVFDMSETAEYITSKKGINPKLTYPKAQVKQAITNIGQQAVQDGSVGELMQTGVNK